MRGTIHRKCTTKSCLNNQKMTSIMIQFYKIHFVMVKVGNMSVTSLRQFC